MDPQTEIDDVCKCPICLEVYRNPKYLPCLHTFCEPCLKSFIISSAKVKADEKTKVEFNCPVCRIIVPAADPSLPPEEWAGHFPNNHLMTTLLDKQKLNSNVKLCDPCQVDSSDVTAVSWCKVCNEALCEVCTKCHRNMVATKQHKIVVIAEQEKVSFEITRNEYCQTHKEKQLEAFCFDHNVACCVNCVTIRHRKCDHVTTLEDASKDVQNKPELKELVDRIIGSEKVLSEMLKSTKANLGDIQEQKHTMMKVIPEFRVQVNKHLDDLEEVITQEIQDVDKQLTTEMQDYVFDLENRQKTLLNYQKMFDICVKQSPDTHVFLEMKKMEQKQNETEEHLKTLLKILKRVDCQLKPSSEMAKQILEEDRLWTVAVQKKSINKKVLLPVYNSPLIRVLRIEAELSKVSSFSISGTDIKDAIFLPDGRIAITSTGYIHFCEINGKDQRYLELSMYGPDVYRSQLYGMALLNENEIIVARPSAKFAHYVDFRQKKILKTNSLELSANGITIFNKQIVAACGSKILYFNFDFQILKRLNVKAGVNNITAGPRCLVYTNSNTNSVHGITFEGEELFEYKHPDLKSPRGVTTDDEGNIFVTGYDSSNVQQVSPEGKFVCTVLGMKDGIKNPHAICFSKPNGKLLVTHSGCIVNVYDRI